jgi:hypothetical protein
MAQSYQLIQAITVGSGGAASIEFTNIPATYTDLKLVLSGRTNRAAAGEEISIRVNGLTTGIYSSRLLYALSSGPVSGLQSSATSGYGGAIPAATATASTFGSLELYIPNYTSSNNKSFSYESVLENNSTSAYELWMGAFLVATSSAITSINIFTANSGSYVQYSTAYLYGVGGSRASGGTITADGNYTYHTFTSSGTFTTSEKVKGAEVLVVAGGGGGSISGGGAGGVFYTYNQTLAAGNSYTVVVGSGGAAGTSGSNSTLASFVATGGGTGGYNTNGVSGGSGGGAGTGTATTYTGGSSTQSSTSGIGYGFAGGNAASSSSGNEGGAGGGGAGAVGQNMPDIGKAGAGGAGISTYHDWHYATSTGVTLNGVLYIAGGGGGSGKSAVQPGGTGGGGNGGSNSAGVGTNGTANTGGGGGGNVDATSYSGGSGLVIIRYPNS